MSNKKQLKKLVELLAANPSIALGVCSKSASQKVFKLFTPELNKLGPPIRESSTWMRVRTNVSIFFFFFCSHFVLIFFVFVKTLRCGPI